MFSFPPLTLSGILAAKFCENISIVFHSYVSDKKKIKLYSCLSEVFKFIPHTNQNCQLYIKFKRTCSFRSESTVNMKKKWWKSWQIFKDNLSIAKITPTRSITKALIFPWTFPSDLCYTTTEMVCPINIAKSYLSKMIQVNSILNFSHMKWNTYSS